jgi:hypothetical protein
MLNPTPINASISEHDIPCSADSQVFLFYQSLITSTRLTAVSVSLLIAEIIPYSNHMHDIAKILRRRIYCMKTPKIKFAGTMASGDHAE